MLTIEGHRLIPFEVAIETERLDAHEELVLALMLRM